MHLGQPGKDLNTDIASLVASGLPPGVQKLLDIVRVIGNEAVHPGAIDLRDDLTLAATLFGLVNLITEKMISDPNQLDALYAALPEGKREGIARRDAKRAP